MRRIIADIYKIIYKITGNKLFSLSFALVYITILNLLTIYGLCTLLMGLLHILIYVLIAFSRPYIYGTIVVVLVLNLTMMMPLKNLSKERKKPYFLGPIIVYSLISVLLFCYTKYSDRLFYSIPKTPKRISYVDCMNNDGITSFSLSQPQTTQVFFRSA